MSPCKPLLLALSFLLLVLHPSLVFSRPRNLHGPRKHLSNMFQSLQSSYKGQNAPRIHELKQYLHHLGYYPNHANLTNNYFDDHLESSIKTFQQYYHLNVTGHLNPETIELMFEGRFCGVPDNFLVNDLGRTSNSSNKFHVHYSFFPGRPRFPDDHLNLFYGFSRLQHFDKEALKPIIARAFKRWQDASRLTFQEKMIYVQPADILLGFESRNHGDSMPFDGPGGVVAHAYSQAGAMDKGKLHFDTDETNWSIKDVPGPTDLDFETVALHEIGHILGLGHSTIESAVMYPYISGGVTKRDLTQDEISGMNELYGGKKVNNRNI